MSLDASIDAPVDVSGDAPVDASPVDALAAAVTAFGLPTSAGLPTAPLGETTWSALLATATRERITPLLGVAVSTGAFPVTPAQRDEAVRAHERAMRLCVQLERSLLAVAADLDGAGIASRVLKGPAVAHLDYPDPAWRGFGDVDLLVHADGYDRAIEMLVAAGGERRYREARPGFDRRFGKGACVVQSDGTQIDVHRTFVAGPFGIALDADVLFDAAEPVTLGGRSLPALSRAARLLHACFHAALGDEEPRLVALRDVAQLALDPRADLDTLRRLANAARADAVVARGVVLAWDRLSLAPTELSEWARGYVPDRFQARALRAYTVSGRSYATQAVAGLSAVHGLSAKVAYTRALLFPAREHIAGRDASYPRRIGRALRALRTARSAP